MNETKKRIAEYKKKLPKLKEKVLATALLVILAFAMATTSTFAWLVLSRAPEVSGATTALAANGNLEIALVGPSGDNPADSAVGDSNLDLILKNITWGNLVNLSDPRYGLDNLVLRPAQLNTADLNTQPLYGAEYSADGRIEKLNTDFGYATWVEEKDRFEITKNWGIRVISSVTRTFADEEKERYELQENVKALNLYAGNEYLAIANRQEWMQSLATMMGLYMTARMNPEEESLYNSSFDQKDVQHLVAMYEQFLVAFDKEAEAMAALLNYQIYSINGTTTPTYTAEDIWNNEKLPVSGNNLNKKVTDANGNAKALQLKNLKTFRDNRATIEADLVNLQEIANGRGDFRWKDSGLNNVVNNLVNVGTCTVGADNTPINSIGASNAANYLSGTQEAKITNGILYNFEYRTGTYIEVKELSISAKVKRMGITVPASVKANVTTTAPRNTNLFKEDLDYANSLYTTPTTGGTMVANDTYGLAVDLWVRTNAEGSFLTLGGNVLVETRKEFAKTRDADGNEVDLYTITIEGENEGESVTVELFEKDGVWYDANTYAEYDLEGATPVQKEIEVEYVVGYEGENRVWDGSYGLSVNSTTQGSGSCYVFYADTPEDQAKSLTLLASMKIAFADEDGVLLASAEMDTEHFYAKDGKVIVPMVLNANNSIYLGEDIQGKPRYAIMPLQRNKATRITAILYLDGTKLDNSQVLSAASIQGQLNLQFESSADLNNIDNEELRVQELKVSATLDKHSFNYDEATEANPMKTKVEVVVDGNQPKTMTAFFIRKINDTQGSREETMTFTQDAGSGKWISSYTFTAPGNYILRSVRLDGIEYDLETTQEVKIEGFTLTELDWDLDNVVTFMTANSTVTQPMWLSFASDDINKMPKTVHGRFIREGDGSVANVQFTYDPTTAKWRGTVTFAMSGEYTLQYLVLDGEYQEIPEGMRKYVTAYLGMRVNVYTTSPQSFKYLRSEMEENGTDLLHMQVEILDDEGNELPGLTGVKMTYARQGSVQDGKMNTDLKWNGEAGYYTGDFDAILAGVGVYYFEEVIVGSSGNIITNAITSPEFRIMSPEPPQFLSSENIKYTQIDNLSYQFTQNGDASLSVVMKNAGATSVKAVFLPKGAEDTEENRYYVMGTRQNTTMGDNEATPTDETKFTFRIPNGSNGKQDGTWTIVELQVWNYYDDKGDIVTEESPMIIGKDKIAEQANNAETNTLSTKVVATVQLSFGDDANKNYNGAFLETHKLEGLSVTATDLEGDVIPTMYLTKMELQFKYNGDSLAYGGYESDTLKPMSNALQVTLVPDADSDEGLFVQSESKELKYAGSWDVEVIRLNGTAFDGKVSTPKITVSSVAPTVMISAVSPSNSVPTKITWTKNWRGALSYTLTDNKASQLDTSKNEVTVYAKATTGSDGEGVGTGDAGFARPSLTFTAGGIDSSTKVTFTIPKGNATEDINVTLTGTTGIAYALGSTKEVYSSWSLATYSVMGYFGHGDQTISKVTVTKGDITYTVTLDKPIVIHNPSSVNKTS